MRGKGQHMAVYVDMLAERYGWTYEYIENLPMTKMEALLTVVSEKAKAQKKQQEKARQQAARGKSKRSH